MVTKIEDREPRIYAQVIKKEAVPNYGLSSNGK